MEKQPVVGVGAGAWGTAMANVFCDAGHPTTVWTRDPELAKAPDTQHIPMVLGSIVLTYNLDGVTTPLKFDGDTVSKIWLGKINRWDDPALSALNPGVTLPAASIAVVSRSDSSGTEG